MKNLKNNTQLAALGLILLVSPWIIDRYATLPDFIDGFLRGAGIGLIILNLWIQYRKKAYQGK